MSGGNELIQFIIKNNLNASAQSHKDLPSSGGARQVVKPNFLSLTGGSWHIPKSLLHEFYGIVRRMIVAKVPISIVEVRTDIFKYFIDLDIMSPCAIKLDTLYKISTVIHECVKRECVGLTGNGLNLVQYGYMAAPRELLERKCVKTGVHLYYPDLHTNSEQALELRKRLIVCFKSMPEFDSEMLKWEEVIDESVYKSSGLRLPHIPKLKRCRCKKVNGDCEYGCTLGVINENAVYFPEWCIPGSVDKLKNNLRYSLEITQIRTEHEVVNFRMRDRSVTDVLFDMPADLLGMGMGISLGKGAESSRRELSKIYDLLDNPSTAKRGGQQTTTVTKGLPSTNMQNFYVDDEHLLPLETQQKVEGFIRRNFESYQTIAVTMVKRVIYKASNRNDVYTKYYVHTTSRFCMNISREHRSNHIYFIIFISGRSVKVSQRCHCTCTTPHFGTKELCKTYSSRPVDIKIGTDLYRALMPPAQKRGPVSYEDYDTAVSHTLNIDITDDKSNTNAIISNLREMASGGGNTSVGGNAVKAAGFDFSGIQTKPKANSLASKLTR